MTVTGNVGLNPTIPIYLHYLLSLRKPAPATVTLTPKANGCTGPTATFNITVHPPPRLIIQVTKSL